MLEDILVDFGKLPKRVEEGYIIGSYSRNEGGIDPVCEIGKGHKECHLLDFSPGSVMEFQLVSYQAYLQDINTFTHPAGVMVSSWTSEVELPPFLSINGAAKIEKIEFQQLLLVLTR